VPIECHKHANSSGTSANATTPELPAAGYPNEMAQLKDLAVPGLSMQEGFLRASAGRTNSVADFRKRLVLHLET
jgi:hypothetical protein